MSREVLVVLAASALAVLASAGDVPVGHLQPLGYHRPADGEVDSYDYIISPREFWEKYASKRRPVVFRGAGNHSDAMRLWTNDYLSANYGDLEVKLEGKREKLGKMPVGERGVGRDTIRNFLNTYEAEDKYIVSQLPEPMYKDFMVPPCLLCGTFKRRLLEVNLWISSGGSRSLLHRDADNAINCLLAGRKDWIMVAPGQEHLLSMADEDAGALGGFSLINVQAVNLLKHPKFKQVRWTYSNLTAGDCIFIPYGHFHQVRSYDRNVAVSVLFARLTEFTTQPDCPGNDSLPSWDLLSNQHIAWSYPGFGKMSMGNSDPEHVKESFLQRINEDPQTGGRLTKETFMDEMVDVKALPKRPPGESYGPDFEQCWNMLDTEGRGYLTKEELENLSHEQLQKLTIFMDEDPANMPDYEHYHISVDAVRSFVKKLLSKRKKTTEEQFFRTYQKVLQGSELFAEKLFAKLDSKKKGFLTKDDIPADNSPIYNEYFRDFGKRDSGNEQFDKTLREDYDPEEVRELNGEVDDDEDDDGQEPENGGDGDDDVQEEEERRSEKPQRKKDARDEL